MRTTIPTIFIQGCSRVMVVKDAQCGSLDIEFDGGTMAMTVSGVAGQLPELVVEDTVLAEEGTP